MPLQQLPGAVLNGKKLLMYDDRKCTYFLRAVLLHYETNAQKHYLTWYNVTELITEQKKPVADK